MRFFSLACIFGLCIACLGCITHNWTSSLFTGFQNEPVLDDVNLSEKMRPEVRQIQSTGSDARARSVERNLGLK